MVKHQNVSKYYDGYSYISFLASLQSEHSFFNMRLALVRLEVHNGLKGMFCFSDILRLRCMPLKLY